LSTILLSSALLSDHGHHRCQRGGRPVEPTVKEYELLRVLLEGARRVVGYEALLRQVWGERGKGDAEPVRS